MREQFGDSEGADGGHKDHDNTAIDSRHRERYDDLPEAFPAVGAEVLRRLHERVVHFLECIVDGVNHERQVVVAQTEEQRSLSQRQSEHIEQFDRSYGAEQEVYPHWQYKEHRHHFRRPEIRGCHDISSRVPDQETDEGIENRNHQRVEKRADGFAMGEELRKIAQCEVTVDIRKGIDGDEHQRQNDKQRHE